MKQGEQEPQAQQGSTGSGGGALDAIAARILQAGGEGDSQQGDIGGQAGLKELKVDVGGVERVVKVEDLVAAFNDRETTTKTMQQVNDRMQELSRLESVRKLEEQIGSLDPARRAKVLNLLAGDDEDDDIDDHVQAAFPKARQPNGSDRDSTVERDVASKLSYMEQALQTLAAREMARIREENHNSLASKVDREMAQYPLFKQNAVAASMAKDSIMAMLAADQSAKPETVVRSAAGKLQELLNLQQQALNEESGVPRTMVRQEHKPLLTADGLRSGALRKIAEQYL